MDLSRQPMDEAAFRAAHAADRMAREKLDEGIAGFSKAILAFEKLLEARHGATPTAGEAGRAAGRFFEIYDFDGDGYITREEWGGAAAVFAALDADGDGRITPQELAAGLGDAHLLGRTPSA